MKSGTVVRDLSTISDKTNSGWSLDSYQTSNLIKVSLLFSSRFVIEPLSAT